MELYVKDIRIYIYVYIYIYKTGNQGTGSRVQHRFPPARCHPLKSMSKIQCLFRSLPDRFGIDFGSPNGSQIEAHRGSRHAFWCISVSDQKKQGSCRLHACIINIAKMQSDCENTCVFLKICTLSVLSFLFIILSRGSFKKDSKIHF